MDFFKLGDFPEAVIRAGLFLDGTGGPPVENVLITIKKGLISHVSPACKSSIHRTGHSVTEIDCGDLTVLPGLIDCHVHLALDGMNFKGSLERWDDEEALSQHLAETLENTLHAGVLAVRDGGDRRLIGLRTHRLAGKAVDLPLITVTGGALRKKGSYGSFLGQGLNTPDMKKVIRGMAAAGAAQIKVLVSGIVSFREYGKVGPLQFSREELTLLVAESHSLGLKVMAHASSDAGAALAVQCGVDSLEHGYFISKDTLARMADQGTAWIPTIIPVAAQTREPLKHLYNLTQLGIIEKTYRRQQVMVELAFRMGVTIGVGTDAGAAGVRHGFSYVEELKLLAEAGLPLAGVIRAATANGARILGLEKQMGTVAPGIPAYLIGIRGNQLSDLNIFTKADAVFIP